MVKLFHGFSKPRNKFIRDMVYGMQATGDTVLTDIARTVDSEGRHRSVENRLSRNLQEDGLDRYRHEAVMADAKRFVDKNTLVIVDPTEVCKPHARKMENLTLVRDANRSSKDKVVKTRGYHGCMAVACRSGSRKTVPLALKLWSSNAEGHKGENEEVLDVMRAIDKATDSKGIRVYDRGGDRPALYDYYLDNDRKFITRMKERNLVSWRKPKSNTWLAGQCVMQYKTVVKYDSQSRETHCKIDFGVMPVKLPWRNMSALVLVSAYFTAAWLGRGVRKDLLVAHLELMHKRFNDVPEFFLYALADGIRRAFSRYGTWKSKSVTRPKPPTDKQPDLPGWDELSFIGAG